MKSSAKKVELASVDDLFSTEESRADAQREKVMEIPLSELHPFKDHPFKVKDDEAMMETADSIRQYGVLVPAIARPDPNGGYELVAGHRRHRASELAGKDTTEENVKLDGRKNAEELLQEVSIPREDWKRNVLQLSGGQQQQRVAIARALASEAEVLLADEPTGNLDEDTAGEITELIKKTAHELGKCVIVVTHSKQLAEEADIVLEISQGTLYKREIPTEEALDSQLREIFHTVAANLDVPDNDKLKGRIDKGIKQGHAQ